MFHVTTYVSKINKSFRIIVLLGFLWRHKIKKWTRLLKTFTLRFVWLDSCDVMCFRILTSLVKKFPFSGFDSCDVIRFRISTDNCTMILQYHWTEKIVKIGFFMKILIQRHSWASTKARGQFIKIWNLSEMAILPFMPLVWVPKP